MRIAQIAPLTYTQGGLEYVSFIRGGTGADYHQSPEFYQFPGGDVIMHWNAYDFDECSNETIRPYSVSTDRGLNWTPPSLHGGPTGR
jgi:hypothetical protein